MSAIVVRIRCRSSGIFKQFAKAENTGRRCSMRKIVSAPEGAL